MRTLGCFAAVWLGVWAIGVGLSSYRVVVDGRGDAGFLLWLGFAWGVEARGNRPRMLVRRVAGEREPSSRRHCGRAAEHCEGFPVLDPLPPLRPSHISPATPRLPRWGR